MTNRDIFYSTRRDYVDTKRLSCHQSCSDLVTANDVRLHSLFQMRYSLIYCLYIALGNISSH